MITFARSLVAAMLTLVGAQAVQAQEHYEARVYSNKDGLKLNYRLMIPEGYTDSGTEQYPLVLFLHGAGERGDDNLKTLIHGTRDFASETNRKKYPCFVLVPQCPNDKRWVEVDWSADTHKQPADESVSLALTREVMASLQKQFRIDAKRLYVTGLSMGGYGTWDMVTRTPNVFAAAIPVCGGGDETVAGRIVTVPVWAFHGDKDTAVKPERSRRMIAAIEQAGGKPKYTEYPGVGHNSWAQTYANPDVIAWLFAQKRP